MPNIPSSAQELSVGQLSARSGVAVSAFVSTSPRASSLPAGPVATSAATPATPSAGSHLSAPHNGSASHCGP